MSGLSRERMRGVLAWLAILLLVVPVGGALWLGVVQGESPCILCWAQRTSMLLIALVVLFVVRYGMRPRYLGLLVLLGAWGTFMGIRHSSLHVARDVGQGFAGSILGAHTYVWAWVIHWLVLMVGGALLLVLEPWSDKPVSKPGRVGCFAMGLLVFMAAGNALQAFVSTGPPPFIGQADPVRISLNPRYWVWSFEEIRGSLGWRGSWNIPEPDASSVDPDPAHGPLAGIPALTMVREERVTAPVEGAITGFALAPGGGGMAASQAAGAPAGQEGQEAQEERAAQEMQALVITEGYGVYVLDGSFARVLHRVVLDPQFSVDLTPLAGAAVLEGDTLAVLSNNKSYVLLAPDAEADPVLAWRHFLETDGTVSELTRSRFSTMRARQMYASALAYDAEARELITVGVPSPGHEQLVVSRFDRGDFGLSSEFLPGLGVGLTLADAERGPDEYYATGAAAADGLLYAVSAAYSTLLVIDLRAKTLTAAYALPGVSDPVGVAVRGGELLVAQGDGKVAVFERPGR